MNNSGGGEHEPSSTEKGLKMKIKRTKNIGQGTKTEGTNSSKHEIVKGAAASSANVVACGNNSKAPSAFYDSSNSSSSTSGSSLPTTTSAPQPTTSSTMASSGPITTPVVACAAAPPTAGSTTTKMATHSPFEKLKQAILEQEKQSKHAKQVQLQQKQDASKDKVKAAGEGVFGGRDSGYNMNSVSFSRALGGGVTPDSGSTSSIMSSGFATSLKQQNKSDPYEFNAKNEDRMGNATLPSAAKKMKTEKDKNDMRDAMTDTSHVCVMTDPDCLGPCEPGTSVILEGIVWQETENGLLVVNVTWRGKTYVGTLLDATKHEWAPPSFRSDSPQDPDARTPRGGRGKRGRTTMNSMGGRGTRTTRNSSSQQSYNPPPSPAKNNSCPLPSAGEKRRPDVAAVSEMASPAKKPRFEIGDQTTAVNKPSVLQEWFVCSHPDCSKRYRDVHALKFHQNSAHKDLLLQVEQTSEHNKTHVRFAGMQQTTAAQTEEKPKEKKNKKKKNKKSKSDQQMEVDEAGVVNNENVNNTCTSVAVKTEPMDSPSSTLNTVTRTNSSSSPEVPRKQAAIPIQVASMTVQGPPAPTPRTVTAPIVSVPVGIQSSPPGGGVKIEAGSGNVAQLSKEEKEKKKEKKKKKKEKKEKKLLEQQLLQKDGGGLSGQQVSGNGGQQKVVGGDVNGGGDSKSSPISGSNTQGSVARGLTAVQQQQQRADNKLKDSAAIPESVHSPAYSDISDEGNDNVPVLENEVELAKKQSQTIQGACPKESNGESVPKGLQQEPPNLTPVITHTGHSKNGPPGTTVPPPPPQQQQQQQAFTNKDVPRPTNLSIRNPAPQQVNTNNPDMNRPKEQPFSGRENMKPQPGNEIQHGRANLQQKHPVFGNFPPGYNVNQNPNNAKPNQSMQTQDRLTPQKVLEEKLRRPQPEPLNQGPPLSGGPLKPSSNPGIMERMERHSDLVRRTVDSNMNMPHKLPGASSTNSPQMTRPNNPNMSPGSDLSKQLPPTHSGKSDVPKANSVEQQHYKQIPGGMSMSERQSENEKILKENLELKTQMNVSDKEKAAMDASLRQKDMHRLFLMQHHHQQAMQQQQQHQQQQQRHMDYPRRFEHPQNRDKAKLPGEPQESPKGPPTSSHSMTSHPGMSRRENSPMPSPKTKAELKQGADRKDIHPQSFGKPMDHRPIDLQRQMDNRAGERTVLDRHGERERERLVDRSGDRGLDRSGDRGLDRSSDRGLDRHGQQDSRSLERPPPSGDRRMDRGESRHLERPGESRHLDRPGERSSIEHRHGEQQHSDSRYLDKVSDKQRPIGDSSKQDVPLRKEAPKSPAPAPSMSSPSMSSPAPAPASIPHPPPASVPHPYSYSYPGYPHGVYPGVPFPMPYPGHPYMPYPMGAQDGKALDILQQQASQYYRDQQVRAQDLRKVTDRKSPNPEGERPKSRHGAPEKRESPNLGRPSQLPHQHPVSWYNLHNGGPVPMMQHSPQSSSAKH